MYLNGEIIHEQTGLCIDVAGYSGEGTIGLFHCELAKDQAMNPTNIEEVGHKTYMNLPFLQNGLCLSTSNEEGTGVLSTKQCSHENKWEFNSEDTALHKVAGLTKEWK